MEPSLRKLNVGCGRNILEGWINLDVAPLPGVDLVADLDRCADTPLPLANESVDELLLSHVIEHIRNPLPLMQELHRIAAPNAVMTIRCPYGSSDDAFEDPTHVRQYFVNSFAYFSQPAYWRADYGYRGDWQPTYIKLFVNQQFVVGKTQQEVVHAVTAYRNVVREIVVQLTAVKPIRQPLKELEQNARIEIQAV